MAASEALPPSTRSGTTPAAPGFEGAPSRRIELVPTLACVDEHLLELLAHGLAGVLHHPVEGHPGEEFPLRDAFLLVLFGDDLVELRPQGGVHQGLRRRLRGRGPMRSFRGRGGDRGGDTVVIDASDTLHDWLLAGVRR